MCQSDWQRSVMIEKTYILVGTLLLLGAFLASRGAFGLEAIFIPGNRARLTQRG